MTADFTLSLTARNRPPHKSEAKIIVNNKGKNIWDI